MGQGVSLSMLNRAESGRLKPMQKHELVEVKGEIATAEKKKNKQKQTSA